MNDSRRGFALILALIVLALLSLLAAGLLTAMVTETRIADNYRTEAQLLYVTEAGIEDGREALRVAAPFVSNKPLFDRDGREAGRYTVTLVRESPPTLRSVGVIGNARKTVEVRLKKSGFPRVPDAITLDEDIPLPPELDAQLGNPAGLERIVQGIARNATDLHTPDWNASAALGTIGSAADYRVVVVGGDCDFGNASGYGVLLVRGELRVSGNFSWRGLVLVIGQGVMRSEEGAVGTISGAVFLARTRNVDRSPGNPLGTLLNTRGAVSFALPVGSVTVQFSDSEINLANQRFPYVVTTYREF